MKYLLTAIDDAGNIVLDIDVTADQCMPLIAEHIQKLKETKVDEIVQGTVSAFSKRLDEVVDPGVPASAKAEKVLADIDSEDLDDEDEDEDDDEQGTFVRDGLVVRERDYLPEPAAQDTGTAFDKPTFNLVVKKFKELGSTRETAKALELPMDEVNRAVRFTWHGWYVKGRLKIKNV